jgi:hypothetical protein
MRAAIIVASLASAAVLAHSTAIVGSAALADPIYCSTWQGVRTCSSPGGYLSHEWSRDGMRFGQDSDGNRWTSSRWQGKTPPPASPRSRIERRRFFYFLTPGSKTRPLRPQGRLRWLWAITPTGRVVRAGFWPNAARFAGLSASASMTRH